jgi:TBC1 domain family protein 5
MEGIFQAVHLRNCATNIIPKLFLTTNEPLQSGLGLVFPLDSLRASRREYAAILLEKMRAPDGSFEKGFVLPGSPTSRRMMKAPGNLETNNPLSLHTEVRGC